MVDLTTKNPFGSVNLLKPKHWLGIGAFVIVAGIAVAGIKFVAAKAESVNPIDDLVSRVM